jgi:hypothetical protein
MTMKRTFCVGLAALCLTWATSVRAGTLKCAADAVKVGNVCVDKYEASVWQIAPSNTGLVKLVQKGKATLADLTAGGATQLSPSPGCAPAYPGGFPADGNWTAVLGSDPPSPGVYAVSIPSVPPSACTTWFQASQACVLSGKHLATNREWQDAASGTPDGAPCVVSAGGPANTGANAGCVSNWRAFDMVGNVDEWVADWVPRSTGACPGWDGFSDDFMCLSGASTTATGPGALFRGGSWSDGPAAGVFAVNAFVAPSVSGGGLGFRCAR